MKKAYLILIFAANVTLFTACKKSNTSPQNVSQTENINKFSEKSANEIYTKLGLACKENRLTEVKALINQGADINLAKTDDIYEYDALYVAIENKNKEIVEYLLNHGAKINKVYTEDGLTPLVLASKLSLYEISEILIKNGARADGEQNMDNESISFPLQYAIENNNIELAKLLINNGASIDRLIQSDIPQNILNSHQWKKLFQSDKINANWKGVYYYKPQSDPDSIGSYYIDIDQANSDFGFSGKNSFKFKVKPKQEQDSLLLYDTTNKNLVGKIYKKSNQFWIKSDFIGSKEKNKTNNVFLLKYTKSADDLD